MQDPRHQSTDFMIPAMLILITLMASVAAYPQTCGSVLQQDTVLTANIGPCPGGGLAAFGHITVDLNGFTISGQGHGDGISAEDVTIRGPGRISNFDIGVHFTGGNAATPNVVRHLSLMGNRVGIVLNEGSGFTNIVENTITGGATGVAVVLSAATIKGNLITHNALGISVFDPGSSVAIGNNTVDKNNIGLTIDFADSEFSNDPVTVRHNDFSGNNGNGVTMRGTHITFAHNTVQDNGGDGIVLSSLGSLPSSGNLLHENVVRKNARFGISVVNGDGPAPNQIVNNDVKGNGGFDLNWDQVGANSCWRLNDFGSSNPSALPVCP